MRITNINKHAIDFDEGSFVLFQNLTFKTNAFAFAFWS